VNRFAICMKSVGAEASLRRHQVRLTRRPSWRGQIAPPLPSPSATAAVPQSVQVSADAFASTTPSATTSTTKLSEAEAQLTADSQLTADATVIPAPVSIIPTIYPQEPSGAVIVHNHITINVRGAEFGELNEKLEELPVLLRRSNEVSGEVRDQLIAEITAGKVLLTAPKLDPKLIEALLKRPLMFITEKAAGAVVGAAAVTALALLGKITGLW
jgi:hypothetical protein